MNDIQNKKLAFVVIAIVMLFGILLCLCCRSSATKDVPGQRARAGAIGAELGDAQKAQQELQRGISEAADRTTRVESRIDSAAQRAGDLASQIASDGTIIEECECILRGVRKRGAK